MGSSSSKPELSASVSDGSSTLNKEEASEQQQREEPPTSGCPMHKKDGSYTFNPLAAIKTHGPTGSKPLNDHTEYNVYGQKINPDNQMPSQANQSKAIGQSSHLSTERVKSSIPKVKTFLFAVCC